MSIGFSNKRHHFSLLYFLLLIFFLTFYTHPLYAEAEEPDEGEDICSSHTIGLSNYEQNSPEHNLARIVISDLHSSDCQIELLEISSESPRAMALFHGIGNGYGTKDIPLIVRGHHPVKCVS